jgi:ATP phosphoribosyltransferase regulatory subunit
MVYQPPIGSRDLLPLDVTQKRWIEDRLQSVFHRWGYQQIITSTLERMDTLMAGGAIERSTLLQVQNAAEEALGLRPELTASIARTAATRMNGGAIQRLYYSANVFCRAESGGQGGQQEFYQSGVELLGGGGLMADAEMLMMMIDCLENLGLGGLRTANAPPQWSLILGDAGLTRSLLSAFPESCRQSVRRAIAHLDRISLEALPPDLRERALLMLDLRGSPEAVLERVTKLPLDAAQQQSVANLQALVALLQDSLLLEREFSGADQVALPIVLDLSLIRTFDYYTGIVFEVASATGQQILGQGGRYDQLLGLYHPQGQSMPGIGFCLQMEALHRELLRAGQLPMQSPITDWLVVSTSPETNALAFHDAQKRRDGDTRVELDLGNQPRPQVRDGAIHRGIAQIAWINADGTTTVETLPAATPPSPVG